MLFPTLEFASFFLFVFYVNWALVRRNVARKVFLLAVSYFFYATWDVQFLLLLLGSSLCNFALGIVIDKLRTQDLWAKLILIFGVAVNLGILGIFKYYNFFASSLSTLCGRLGVHLDPPLFELILPLGISFFTFQGISYIVDIYKNKISARHPVLDVLLFVAFFPHLLAGPIVRGSEFLPQLRSAPNPNRIQTIRSLLRITFGLFKKMILANYLGVELVDPIFSSPQTLSAADALLGAYAYAIYIFCDFSAYSDMAIGFAELLGVEFPKNFEQPYRSQSLQEFWRRWHISLSSWLRDYLFISLGGSRVGEFRTYFNLIVTMLLGGIWHGASWTFVVWGMLHGVGLAVERWVRIKFGEPCRCFWSQLAATVRVFHFVCLAWIFFRCESFDKAFTYLSAFRNWSQPAHFFTPFAGVLIFLGAVLNFTPKAAFESLEVKLALLPRPVLGFAFGFFLVFLSALSPDEIPPFIYFRF